MIARNTRTGEFVVAWTDSDGVGEGSIAVRRVSALGAARGSSKRVAAQARRHLTLRGAAFDSASRRYLVAFGSFDLRTFQASAAVRSLTARGAPVGPVRQVALLGDPGSETSGPQRVAPRRFLLAFERESPFEDREIFAQLLDPAGRRLLPRPRRVSRMGPEPRSPTDPALAFIGIRPVLAPPIRAGSLVLWQGTLPGDRITEIYGRRERTR